MDELLNFFKGLNDLHTKQMEMAAIWRIGNPVHVVEDGVVKRTVRVAPDHLVRIEGKQLVDVSDTAPATHKIIGCYGTISNTDFQLSLLSLENNEPCIIDL